MGDNPATPISATEPPAVTLLQTSTRKKRHRPAKIFRLLRNVVRSFPIITPAFRLPSLPAGQIPDHHLAVASSGGGSRVTVTLFGWRKGPVSLSVQESPRTLPALVVELGSLQTAALQKELSEGLVRIALECEKTGRADQAGLMEEPLWTVFCNGKKIGGYGVRREAEEEDLRVMEVLRAVSMGAGVLPVAAGEVAYMRGVFERMVGSNDSETLYMMTPGGDKDGPDLSIFFVRV